MLSTPPASMRCASPDLIARAAVPTASRPDPQRRLIVEPGHRGGQTGEQHGHARDVAVVLPGLVGAAHDAVVEHLPIDAGVTCGQGADRMGGEVVGPDIFQRAGVAADRGAGEVADICFGHGRIPPVLGSG